MNGPTNPPELESALKSLWGASQLPFGAAVDQPYASESFQLIHHRLEQLVAVRACGLLHGPNGVGKTLLVQHFLRSLPDKRYKTLVLSHSSVTGTDLMRLLCSELGQTPRMRRSDNVLLIRQGWQQLDRLWPVVVIDEAQNLSATALTLLLQAGNGLPRLLNHLAQRALEEAASQNARTIAATHVQRALELLPWVAQLTP